MLLYRCVKYLMYLLLCCIGLTVLAGQKDHRYMAMLLVQIPACLLMYWLKNRLWLRANQKKPVVCVEAILVNHRQEFSGMGMQHYEKSYLTFQVAGGKKIEFEVSQDEFDRIQLGAKGPLKYQGCIYLSFRKPCQ